MAVMSGGPTFSGRFGEAFVKALAEARACEAARKGLSTAERFKEFVESLSPEEREEFRKFLVNLYEIYQGPGGP